MKKRNVSPSKKTLQRQSNNTSLANTDTLIYHTRFQKHLDELKWLYMELYNSEFMFDELCKNLYKFYRDRKTTLKDLDKKRESAPAWFQENNMLGMMLYVDNFAKTLKGVEKKLDYIQSCNVNYIHLMPLLESPKGRSDGGYAVSNFRNVQPELGTIEDLSNLADKCHEQNISICLDFVMNHTSEEHEWAIRAKQGEEEYMNRYFFFSNYDIPTMYEKTVPQVFPTTAPGNFTYLPELNHFVMTTFYPYQWDLNYKNPVVFNEMMYHFLFLANLGIDIIRIDAVPYIWKEIGTSCRNLPQVHTIVRMMRMINEIVCPSVLLLGEVVMEPEKVTPYFGTIEKPECHMLYNVTTMATIWNSVATQDSRLLKLQMNIINNLPKQYTFLNYLRCHDDIGWGLDFSTLKKWDMKEIPHKQYLNDFFTGKLSESFSRGELYNNDPVTKDARFCGTAASMCGIEKAGFIGDKQEMKKAIALDIMLHAYMFMQSGIPIIYSGDEIGQLNDYSYKNDPMKASDSRYLHRGKFQWELTKKIKEKGSVQEQIFHALNKLAQIRKNEQAFHAAANVWTIETNDISVLCLARSMEDNKIIGIFNFSPEKKTAWIQEEDGVYEDLLTKEHVKAVNIEIHPYGFYWLKRLELK